MAKQRSSFAKLQRDKAKKEKAAERMAARKQRNVGKQDINLTEEPQEEITAATIASGKGAPSPDELLRLVEELIGRKESGTISEEEFEEARFELFARVSG